MATVGTRPQRYAVSLQQCNVLQDGEIVVLLAPGADVPYKVKPPANRLSRGMLSARHAFISVLDHTFAPDSG